MNPTLTECTSFYLLTCWLMRLEPYAFWLCAFKAPCGCTTRCVVFDEYMEQRHG